MMSLSSITKRANETGRYRCHIKAPPTVWRKGARVLPNRFTGNAYFAYSKIRPLPNRRKYAFGSLPHEQTYCPARDRPAAPPMPEPAMEALVRVRALAQYLGPVRVLVLHLRPGQQSRSS